MSVKMDHCRHEQSSEHPTFPFHPIIPSRSCVLVDRVLAGQFESPLKLGSFKRTVLLTGYRIHRNRILSIEILELMPVTGAEALNPAPPWANGWLNHLIPCDFDVKSQKSGLRA